MVEINPLIPPLEVLIEKTIITFEDQAQVEYLGNLNSNLIGQTLKVRTINAQFPCSEEYTRQDITNKKTKERFGVVYGQPEEITQKYNEQTYMATSLDTYKKLIKQQKQLEKLTKMFTSQNRNKSNVCEKFHNCLAE
jgi:hypothetical protein